MALPHYQSSDRVSQLAKEAIRLERRGVQELMHVVTSLIERSDNFKEMMVGDAVADMDPQHLRFIDKLEL